MDVAVSTSLTFNNTNVALTAQGGGSFFANNPTTYGSAFLLANLVISGNSFDTLQVGGAAADSITGSEVDAFMFAKQGTASTITDDVGGWGGGDEIWLGDAVFAGLSTVDGPTTHLRQLASSDFSTSFGTGAHITYNSNALWYVADGLAGGEGKITNVSPVTSPAPLASNTLIF